MRVEGNDEIDEIDEINEIDGIFELLEQEDLWVPNLNAVLDNDVIEYPSPNHQSNQQGDPAQDLYGPIFDDEPNPPGPAQDLHRMIFNADVANEDMDNQAPNHQPSDQPFLDIWVPNRPRSTRGPVVLPREMDVLAGRTKAEYDNYPGNMMIRTVVENMSGYYKSLNSAGKIQLNRDLVDDLLAREVRFLQQDEYGYFYEVTEVNLIRRKVSARFRSMRGARNGARR
ncbi:MAG: hypothetical protein SGBAC_001550 [Bacillariaceae sp.]